MDDPVPILAELLDSALKGLQLLPYAVRSFSRREERNQSFHAFCGSDKLCCNAGHFLCPALGQVGDHAIYQGLQSCPSASHPSYYGIVMVVLWQLRIAHHQKRSFRQTTRRPLPRDQGRPSLTSQLWSRTEGKPAVRHLRKRRHHSKPDTRHRPTRQITVHMCREGGTHGNPTPQTVRRS
jgi:hypothetical protein